MGPGVILSRMFGALVDLSRTGHYIHWGFVQLSVANAIVILTMVVDFALALLLPFHASRKNR